MTRVRFAPSPTGYLHVGGARTALFNWLFARKTGGTFVLRIEDTDVERSSAEMTEGILEAMTWLGLQWDEGPYFQSKRLDRYREAAARLAERGHAYHCFCSPAVLDGKRRASGSEGAGWQYDRTCASIPRPQALARIASGEAAAIRFRVPDGQHVFKDEVFGEIATESANIEDFVLLRSDGHPTYHLSVVVDDIEMRITDVIRGADHISNTPKQVLLYRALDATAPHFAHVPLILGPDKTRMSKRHGATSVMAYRDQGILPAAFRNFLVLLGWSPGDDREMFDTAELVAAFSLDGISKANAVFNPEKLAWFNAQYINRSRPEDLLDHVRKGLEDAGLWRDTLATTERVWFCRLIELLQPRARTLLEFAPLAAPYLQETVSYDDAAVRRFFKDAGLPGHLLATGERLATAEPFDLPAVETVVRGYAESAGVKAGVLINGMRVALTGREASPGIFEVITLLGRDRVVGRLKRAAAEILPSS